MSFRATVLRRHCFVVLLLAMLVNPMAFGQLRDEKGQLISPIAFSNIGAITTSFVTSPNLDTETAAIPGSNNQWLKVEFHYGTTTALKTKFLDAVEFKVVIEGRDPDAPNPAMAGGKGVAVGLTGSVTYLYIAPNKDIYGVFFVHPSTLARFSTEGGYEDFDRKFNIHIEAYVGGVLQDQFDKNKEKDPAWFKALQPVSGLVYRQDQTPFLVSNPDRYPQTKLTAPSP